MILLPQCDKGQGGPLLFEDCSCDLCICTQSCSAPSQTGQCASLHALPSGQCTRQPDHPHKCIQSARNSGFKIPVPDSLGGLIDGNPDVLPATKDTISAPACAYGLSKRNAMNYLNIVTTNSNMRCVNFCFANIYGPWQASHGKGAMVALFTRKILDKIVPLISRNIKQTCDFVFVKNVAVVVDCAISSQANGKFQLC